MKNHPVTIKDYFFGTLFILLAFFMTWSYFVAIEAHDSHQNFTTVWLDKTPVLLSHFSPISSAVAK